uniref:Prenyltransferase idtC n=1 Tax=Claviceps paspali TaxID=40601 RepID=IDTC_CLAPA|nr:RecName: Full=Prenyltransferase idtC; AltName: Full=Indole-diterpene biosynthesis cluster protein C; Flags: Precursor [Claviceps paspali]AFO85422.1 prenyl transferase [Claviceps paspali]
MTTLAWFAGRSMVLDLAALTSAFTVGYLLKSTSTPTSTPTSTDKAGTPPGSTIHHYGYPQGSVTKPNNSKTEKENGSPKDSKGNVPDCPYKYLVGLYGHHHFAGFVEALQPTLKDEDPEKYTLVLDIMDAVHLCLILVDDICDDSPKRKNQTTAHLLFGSCETANRAYLVLTKVINRAMRTRPVLGAELVRALELILEGQDLSLVWRRDGLAAFDAEEGGDKVSVYKKMAQLKTGTLFVLLGRLLNDGGAQLDDVLLRLGWYSQLQNDCKNIYSGEYANNKGAIAEDLRNGEMSFPVVVALGDQTTSSQIRKAFGSHSDGDIFDALDALQSSCIKNKCSQALQEAGRGLENLLAIWGRREHMDSLGS